MALSKAEWKRRVEAVLVLRGEDLSDLKDAVHEHGLPVNAAARAGHESDTYAPNHALALVLAELLEMPTAWFEAEDWRSLIHAEGSPSLRELQDERDLARFALVALRDDLEDLRKGRPPAERPAAGGDT